MNANELRIGNWIWKVYAPYGPDLSREYCLVDLEEIKRACGVFSANSFYHEPIELTPEILGKAGFDGLANIPVFYKEYERGVICVDLNQKEIYLNGHDSSTTGQSFVAPIEYLHQLQNLIHSLTGQELTIKL